MQLFVLLGAAMEHKPAGIVWSIYNCRGGVSLPKLGNGMHSCGHHGLLFRLVSVHCGVGVVMLFHRVGGGLKMEHSNVPVIHLLSMV